jgi:hypothetical protein
VPAAASAAGRDEASKAALPADLALVPRDALGFASVRLAELWSQEGLKDAGKLIVAQEPSVLQNLEKALGVAPDRIERLTIVFLRVPAPREEGPPMVFLVTTTRPYDRKAVLAEVLAGAKEREHAGKVIYVADSRAVHLINAGTYVVGDLANVFKFLDAGGNKGEGPLAQALAAAGKHHVAGGLRPRAILDALGAQVPKEIEPFLPLLQAHVLSAAIDFGKETRAEVHLVCAGESEARDAVTAARAGVTIVRDQLPEMEKSLERMTVKPVAFLKVLKAFGSGLKEAPIEAAGSTATLTLTVKADLATVGLALVEYVQKSYQAYQRITSANNLKQMVLATINLADTNGGVMPAAAIYDKDGKPLLSWRVAILPYIEQEALYKEFHLDEPWDSEHNKKLLPKMPKVYLRLGADPKETKTHYRVFHGPGAAYEGTKGRRYPADFIDGTSNVILIVEAEEGVPWTKPDELPFDPKKDLPKLGFKDSYYFQVAFADGSVRVVTKKVEKDAVKAYVQRASGEVRPDLPD